ncbi:MAG TPA: GMC family oxidoreductase N-terminal domain-containing protein [Pyrinomonadaceae bacterium]|nr:GMC family oxidoreductase N-terminal domain-containing protein [Pyrinomonadaceae bacterium]
MARLSSPIQQLKPHYTVVVVGSGYGGGIAASRLSRAGQQVCVLERGKEFQPGDFDDQHQPIKPGEYPDTEAEAVREVQIDLPKLHTGSRTGLYDLRVNEDINVFVGCGLGGTSLVNANVALQADPRVFQLPEWPSEFRNNPNLLDDGYQRAREMLKPTPYPDETRVDFPPLAKLEALKKSAAHLNAPFYRPPINVNFDELGNNTNHVGVEQHPCVGCGDCMTGCNYRAKNTVIMNYLPDAKNHGAEIFTQVSVRYISRQNNSWLIHYQLLNTGRDKFDAPTMFVGADIVVLAAGTLGSTEILLRSKNNASLSLSNRVGENFTGNGDVLAFAYNCDQEINGIGFGHHAPIENGKQREKVGPCITGIIDLRKSDELTDGFVIEEGSIAGPFGALTPPMFAAAAKVLGKDTDGGVSDLIHERARELESLVRGAYHGATRNTQTFLVMAHDDDKGRLKLIDDRLRIEWPNVGTQPIFKKVGEKLEQAADALGGTYLKDPISNRISGEDLVTVHPLGGCVMADTAESGVVNHKGQVFSGAQGAAVYEKLYVNDGAVIPRPVGVNPLLTISAIAERCCALMAEDRGWKFDYALPSRPHTEPEPLKLGVRFSESMSGYYSPKVTDDAEDSYQRGMDQGRADGSSFQFILTIISDDLERTVSDVNYVSPMLGSVLAPGLSTQALTVNQGQFNYFLLDRDRVETKRMQYKMKLSSVEGKTFYFYGFKVIHDDTGIDSWSDTTTLYITVYDGEDEKGRIIGKGILRIPIAAFMRQVTTMQITNAKSLAERWQGMLKFGRFFGGQLVDTYGANLM